MSFIDMALFLNKMEVFMKLMDAMLSLTIADAIYNSNRKRLIIYFDKRQDSVFLECLRNLKWRRGRFKSSLRDILRFIRDNPWVL